MARHSQIRIPADQAAGVYEALVTVLGMRADGLADAAAGRGERGVEEARELFAGVESALDVYGWERGPRLEDADLEGPPAMVTDVLHGALMQAAERLATLLPEYHAARASLVDLRAAVHDVDVRLGLFEAHEQAESA